MTILFANNASSTLASSIDDDDTVLQVETGTGALYPSPSGGDYFIVTMQNANGDIERMHCTSRTTDLLTITRGEEGTAAQTWVTGDRVENRISKETLESFLQKTGGELSGDLNLNDNELQNASLTGTTVITGGKTVGTLIRGAVNDASNQISVPSNGTQATAGGSAIVTAATFGAALASALMQAFPTGSVIQWFGSTGAIPSGWHLCDGTNGTPNMQDFFLVGAGGTYALNATGGATAVNTSTEGSHSHGAATGSTAISVAQMPSHQHSGSGTFSFTGSGDDNSQAPITMLEGSNIGSIGTQSITASFTTPPQGGDQGHNHSISTDGSHFHTAATLPPYRALYFIMKL